MNQRIPGDTASAANLTIGQLAQATGVPVATLRTWETRYGAPQPQRLAGGHRRYDQHDVSLVREILRLKSSGLGLAAAVEHATTVAREPVLSLFTTLSGRYAELRPHTLTKQSLLALSHAIEDECCAQAMTPLLFAGFQRERFYRASGQRWTELARTAAATIVFADFPAESERELNRAVGGEPTRLRLPSAAPLRREWFIVCDSIDRPACLVGWEPPGQHDVPDAQRRFETIWTVDARVVRDAARACAAMAVALSPRTAAWFADRLAPTPPAPSADLVLTQRLFERTLSYLESS